jgi:4-hydroxy-3-methylbut-2-enyl diphosphate reductase
MKVIAAAATGMCFGVRDALVTLSDIEQPQSVAIYGELVHNEVVLHQLQTRGFQQVAETERTSIPAAPQIVITAHGISNRRRQELTAAGKTLIDTTCPLVTRLHRAARELSDSGAFVVVIGRADHVEVQGVTDDLESFAVVRSVDEVGTYPATRIGVVCQTTFPTTDAAAIRQQIATCNPTATIQWTDTICQPTKDRQQALNELLDQVQAVVVVGGRQSHNTLRLVNTCRQRGVAVFHIEQSTELDPHWFDGIATVGLTAGTSTLPETLQQVHDRLTAIASH